MKFKNITLCLLITSLVLLIGGCNNNVNDENIQFADTDYSKYIGRYSIVSDEGTKYESKQTLIIKSIDGKTLDFEYELQPYRHTVTITAEQGVFSSETTAEATGTYDVDGQIMPYGFEFKFNDDSIDLKCGFTDELNEQEYITFSLETRESMDVQDRQTTSDSSAEGRSSQGTNSLSEVREQYPNAEIRIGTLYGIERYTVISGTLIPLGEYDEAEDEYMRYAYDSIIYKACIKTTLSDGTENNIEIPIVDDSRQGLQEWKKCVGKGINQNIIIMQSLNGDYMAIDILDARDYQISNKFKQPN